MEIETSLNEDVFNNMHFFLCILRTQTIRKSFKKTWGQASRVITEYE